MRLAERLHGVIPVGDKSGLEALTAEHDAEHLGEGGVVIDDQYATFHRPHRSMETPAGAVTRRRWGSTQKVQRTPIGRVRHPAFGHQRGDQCGGSDVERRVVGAAPGRRHRHAGEGGHLLRRPVLDHDRRPVGGREVDRGQRGGHHERHAMMAGQHGEAVGADLVGHAAVGGDPVGAGDHHVHLPGRHQRRRRRVGAAPRRASRRAGPRTRSAGNPAAAAGSRPPRAGPAGRPGGRRE